MKTALYSCILSFILISAGIAKPFPALVSVDSSANGWIVTVTGRELAVNGRAEIMLLKDPSGNMGYVPGTQKGYISINVTSSGSITSSGESTTSALGDTVLRLSISIQNFGSVAKAYVFAMTGSLEDTIFELDYAPHKWLSSPSSFGLYFDSCRAVTLINADSEAIAITEAYLRPYHDQIIVGNDTGIFVSSTVPPLPAFLKSGDTLLIDVCDQDTNRSAIENLIVVTARRGQPIALVWSNYGSPPKRSVESLGQIIDPERLWPNPLRSEFETLTVSGLMPIFRITISDLLGTQLYSERFAEPPTATSIKPPNLGRGVYFVRIDSGDRSIPIRLIVL